MKTPMQELIEQLKEYYDLELKVSGTKNEPILWAIGKAQALLKKEKDVMYRVYKSHRPITMMDGSNKEVVDGVHMKYKFEHYYNETFNTNDK